MTSQIDVQGLRKEFGPFVAVEDISFRVKAGEVLGFLGPNGAGKSTTMKMLTGFLTPSRGRVNICGIDVLADPVAAKASIGYLPEGAPLYPEMTPASLLDFIARMRGIKGEAKERRLKEVSALVHLEEVWRQPIETLSKGFKRRVGLAQAILHDPEVLILDEPTDGLDPNQKHEVRQLVRRMALHKAVIISTHILEEVRAVCTRAMIIDRGRVVADGTPEGLETLSPRHGAVSLLVDREQAGELRDALEGLSQAERVEASPGPDKSTRLRVFPRPATSVAEPISDLVRTGSWQLREFRQDQVQLDDVFRQLTMPEAAAHDGGQQ